MSDSVDLDEVPTRVQVPVVQYLVGRADHAPRQPGFLAQPEQLLPVMQLREPLGRGHELAVATGAMPRVFERRVRERPGDAVSLEEREEVREDVRAEEVGDQ